MDGGRSSGRCLGLVLNTIVLRPTNYIDAAATQLRAEGHEIRDEDIARLSPLKHSYLNLLGRCSRTAGVLAAGALRPLRDPDGPELDEDDERGRVGSVLADQGGDELAGPDLKQPFRGRRASAGHSVRSDAR